MTRYYNARWLSPECSQLGNVSFNARSDGEAKQKAERIGREIGLPNSRRQLYEGTRLVEDLAYRY